MRELSAVRQTEGESDSHNPIVILNEVKNLMQYVGT